MKGETDGKAKCHNYRTDPFDPGIWLQRDPVNEAGGKNLYAFVQNDALGNYDAFGSVCSCCCAEALDLTKINHLEKDPQYKDRMGFDFWLTAKLRFVPKKNVSPDNERCSLEWWEYCDNPNPQFNLTPDEWFNLIDLHRTDLYSDKYWRLLYLDKPQPCQGPLWIGLPDQPSLPLIATATMNLRLDVFVRSARGCGCPDQRWSGFVHLEVKDGQPVWSKDGLPVSYLVSDGTFIYY